jgi:hypothetical protein
MVHGVQGFVEVGIPAGQPWQNTLLFVGDMQRQRFGKIPRDARCCIAYLIYGRLPGICECAGEPDKSPDALVTFKQQIHDI